MTQQPQFLTSNEVAERWNVHPMTIQRLRASGKGPPYIKLGDSNAAIRYPLADLEQYEEDLKRQAL